MPFVNKLLNKCYFGNIGKSCQFGNGRLIRKFPKCRTLMYKYKRKDLPGQTKLEGLGFANFGQALSSEYLYLGDATNYNWCLIPEAITSTFQSCVITARLRRSDSVNIFNGCRWRKKSPFKESFQIGVIELFSFNEVKIYDWLSILS